jgi:tetratricopeptide (TPR) repeat protein
LSQFLAAALAAAFAAAAPAAPCPNLVTPDALVCRALEAQQRGDLAAAAQGFEQAALAASDQQGSTAHMFAAAGNLWIAANQPAKAAAALDKAIAMAGLTPEQRGEALLDRARAAEVLGDLKTARAKLVLAAPTIGSDPFYWYFSAALAVREGDAATAQSAIAKALSLAPDDPTLLFEAGHVAHFTGDDDKARSYWAQARAGDPDGAIGKAAAKAIELLGVTPTVKLDAPAAK